jgi:hypothetical protein
MGQVNFVDQVCIDIVRMREKQAIQCIVFGR